MRIFMVLATGILISVFCFAKSKVEMPPKKSAVKSAQKSAEKSDRDMSFVELELKYASQDVMAFYTLTYLVEKAADCAQIEKYAPKLLAQAASYKTDWNYGNAILSGNLALGYCEITKGNVAKAEDYLAKAGATPGSPQLDTFGLGSVDMRLPVALLKKGRKESVLKFLEASKKYWEKQFSDEYLSEWKTAINAGKIPTFNKFTTN
jgi:hypothetical protein